MTPLDHPPHGLRHDLDRLSAQWHEQRALNAASLQRRQTMGRLAAGVASLAGLTPVGGCAVRADEAAAASTNGGSGGGSGCTVIPAETAGPFPGDGSNRASGALANVLSLSDIVRADIRSSIGGLSGIAAGVPLNLTLTLVNTGSQCAPLAGRAIYLWQCDREGRYSMYSSGVTRQNYLRGVQVTNDAGQVSFQTTFPGCYPGRWPHIHFEVFSSLAVASRGANAIRTSQLALPRAACTEVFNNASGYSASVAHFAAISLASDFVFGDTAAASQMAALAGNLAKGYDAALTVGLAG